MILRLLLATAVVGIFVAPAAGDQKWASAEELFRLHLTGDPAFAAAAEARFKAPNGLASFRWEFNGAIRKWPAAPSAAFALAVSALAERYNGFWALPILETACSYVRDAGPPSDEELEWHLLVMARLVAGPTDASSFVADQRRGRGELDDVLDTHYKHTAMRFPASRRLDLLWGVGIEAQVEQSLRVWGHRRLQSGPDDPRRWLVRDLADAAVAFRKAQEDPAVRAEAGVRLGRILSIQGKPNEALLLWRQVALETRDERLKFLALLFIGQTLAAEGHPREAEAPLVAALGLRPGAPSAAIPLASLLWLRGEAARAGELAELSSRPSARMIDPWSSYFEWIAGLDARSAGLQKTTR